MRMKHSDEVIGYIKENFGKVSYEDMAAHLNLKVGSVKAIVASNGMNAYTEAEIQYVKDNYKTMTSTAMGKHLGRSGASVKALMLRKLKLSRTQEEILNLAKKTEFTPENLLFIRNNYGKMTSQELATHFGITHGAIRWQIQKMGLLSVKPKDDNKKIIDAQTIKELPPLPKQLPPMSRILPKQRMSASPTAYTKKARKEWARNEEIFRANYKYKTPEEVADDLSNEGRVPVRVDDKTVIWPLRSQCIQGEDGKWKKITTTKKKASAKA
jgi:hypothetical protein